MVRFAWPGAFRNLAALPMLADAPHRLRLAPCENPKFASSSLREPRPQDTCATQFGLLIVGMRRWGDAGALEQTPVVELERVYKLAAAAAKEDETFATEAREELAKLQGGDRENTALWRRFVDASKLALNEVYDRLGVRFDTWRGESAYHDALAGVVERLLDEGIARRDEGAVCVFFGELDGLPPEAKALAGRVGAAPARARHRRCGHHREAPRRLARRNVACA